MSEGRDDQVKWIEAAALTGEHQYPEIVDH